MRHILLGLAVLTGGVAYPMFAHADEISIRGIDMILGGPSMTDTFRRPGALVADTTRGILLIADTGNHRLVAFDRGWRSRGSIVLDQRHASEPSALALDAHGRIFVADRGRKQIEVMDPRGTHITYFMPPLPADATPASPQDIAIGASGRIYLLVSGTHPGLCILDSGGRPLSNIGFLPAGQGLWSAPQALAVNADETRIAIVDATASQSVTILDADGREVHGFGQHGEVEAGFSLPNDVTWGVGNTLWITDTLRHSVSVFNERGTLLGRIGGFGSEPGQFAYPVGCVFLANDRIAVLERANARCQVFEMEVPASIRQATALDLSRSGLAGTLSRTDREEVR